MLKIIVVISCDVCHVAFAHNPTTSGSDPAACSSIVDTLEWAAEQSGWHCFHGRHDCYNCIMEAMHPQEFTSR